MLNYISLFDYYEKEFVSSCVHGPICRGFVPLLFRKFKAFFGIYWGNKLTVLYRNYNLVSNVFCYSPSFIPSVPTPPFHPLSSLVFSSDSQSFIKIKITLVTDVSQKKKKNKLKMLPARTWMNTQKSRFLEKWCHSPPELCCNIQDPQLCAILSILICFTSLEPRSNRVTVTGIGRGRSG